MQTPSSGPPPYSPTASPPSPIDSRPEPAPHLSTFPSPPPYSLIQITAADNADYHHHLLRHALRDLRASQDPSQWGTRQPRHVRPLPIIDEQHRDDEDRQAGERGWRGWLRWLGRLLEPAVPEEGEGAVGWGTMGLIGPPIGMI